MVRDEDECGKKEIPLDANRVDVREIFSPRRSAEVASAFDFVPGTGFDLRTGWDVSTPAG